MEKYLRYYKPIADDKLAIVAMHLTGEANRWYQGYEHENPTQSWDDFKIALLQRFGPSVFADAPAALKELFQTGIVSAYQATFEDLKARLPPVLSP